MKTSQTASVVLSATVVMAVRSTLGDESSPRFVSFPAVLREAIGFHPKLLTLVVRRRALIALNEELEREVERIDKESQELWRSYLGSRSDMERALFGCYECFHEFLESSRWAPDVFSVALFPEVARK